MAGSKLRAKSCNIKYRTLINVNLYNSNNKFEGIHSSWMALSGYGVYMCDVRCVRKKWRICDVPSFYIKRKAVTWYVRVFIWVSVCGHNNTIAISCLCLATVSRSAKAIFRFRFNGNNERTFRASNGKFCMATIINKHMKKKTVN